MLEGQDEDNIVMLIDGDSMSRASCQGWVPFGTWRRLSAVLAAAISLGLGKRVARGREAASCRAGAAFNAAFATAFLAS
jgi:hypothetical protein